MPRREPGFHEKHRFDDGATLEMKIYSVPSSVSGSTHRCFMGRMAAGWSLMTMNGQRGIVVTSGLEEPYAFSTVEQLVADFLNDVAAIRGRRPT
jgi:hypothetical protein